MDKSTQRHKLTKSFVESLPYIETGQSFYRDTELKGFAVRVGKTSKTYIVENKVQGKTVRMTIGKHNLFTAEQARNHARQLLCKMAVGDNPVDEKRNLRAKSVTLAEVIQEYVQTRKTLSPRQFTITHMGSESILAIGSTSPCPISLKTWWQNAIPS